MQTTISNIDTIKEIPKPRDYQVYAREALEWEIVHLLQDEDAQGHRLLSRADLILIYTLYNKTGLDGFLKSYLDYTKDLYYRHGEHTIVLKPHHYLKMIIG